MGDPPTDSGATAGDDTYLLLQFEHLALCSPEMRARATVLRPALMGLWLLTASACLGWVGLEEPQDPDPSGSSALQAYKEESYRAQGLRFTEEVDWPTFLRRVRRARVLLLGDRHDDEELHRAQEALLDRLQREDIPYLLGLEAIGREDEPPLADFLGGAIDLGTLRSEIHRRWAGSWMEQEDLDAPFYRRLLQRARDRNLPVFALEGVPRSNLADRDRIMVRRIERIAHLHRNRLIVVFVGQSHLSGRGHILDRLAVRSVATVGRLSRRLERERQALGSASPWLLSSGGLYFRQSTDSGDPVGAGSESRLRAMSIAATR